MLSNRLHSKTTGIYCLVIGVIVAIAGVYFWASGHSVRGPVLVVVAVVVLAFGVYALVTSGKKAATPR